MIIRPNIDKNKIKSMKIEYTFWQENDGKYLGYLNEYPDHWTQG